MSGGVAEAVKIRLKHPEKVKPTVIDGLDKEGMKQLKNFGKIQSGELPVQDDTPNLVEVMACKGDALEVLAWLKILKQQPFNCRSMPQTALKLYLNKYIN